MIVIEEPDRPGIHQIITKGAFASVSPVCDAVLQNGSATPLNASARQRLEAYLRGRSGGDIRVQASRALPAKATYETADESGLTFLGFLLFKEPPKADAGKTVRALRALGVAAKIVTGDNRYATAP